MRSGYDSKDDFHTLERDIPKHAKAQGETIVLFPHRDGTTLRLVQFLFLSGIIEREQHGCAS